jgi:hypothetical protein
MASEEEQREERRLSRNMDRIERMLTKCIEADRERRKKGARGASCVHGEVQT